MNPLDFVAISVSIGVTLTAIWLEDYAVAMPWALVTLFAIKNSTFS